MFIHTADHTPSFQYIDNIYSGFVNYKKQRPTAMLELDDKDQVLRNYSYTSRPSTEIMHDNLFNQQQNTHSHDNLTNKPSSEKYEDTHIKNTFKIIYGYSKRTFKCIINRFLRIPNKMCEYDIMYTMGIKSCLSINSVYKFKHSSYEYGAQVQPWKIIIDTYLNQWFFNSSQTKTWKIEHLTHIDDVDITAFDIDINFRMAETNQMTTKLDDIESNTCERITDILLNNSLPSIIFTPYKGNVIYWFIAEYKEKLCYIKIDHNDNKISISPIDTINLTTRLVFKSYEDMKANIGSPQIIRRLDTNKYEYIYFFSWDRHLSISKEDTNSPLHKLSKRYYISYRSINGMLLPYHQDLNLHKHQEQN